MKKTLTAFGILLAVLLSGCGSADRVSIDGRLWTLTTVQSGEDGQVTACAPDRTDLYDGAAAVALTCRAEDGVLTLSDETSARSYTGSYETLQNGPEAITYSIAVDDQTGYAVSGWTTYLDESRSPTLILTIGEYTLNFQSEEDA